MTLGADFRLAARTLAKARGFSSAIIATLALAIALETTVIAVVNAYLIRPLPYPEGDRLYQVSYAEPGAPFVRGLEDLDWSSLSDVIEHQIAWDLDVFYLVGGDHTEGVRGAWVTPGFMQGLGIRPVIGRAFAPVEFAPGAPQVALISHALWTGRFGGDSGVVGRTFNAYVSDRPNDPEAFTIVGVLPPDFWHINPYTDVLTPLRATSYPYIVRLRSGVPPSLAAKRITQLALSGGVALPGRRAVELQSVHTLLANRVKPILLAVAAAVSVVLLIACANVAVLVLIRGMRRQKEMAVRLALGGARRHVARMLVVESLLLVGSAALLGTGIAWLTTRPLAASISQQLGRPAPGGDAALSIDLSVATVITSIAGVIALALALAPLLIFWRQDLFSTLRRGRHGGTEGKRARRTRSALITFEVAGSLALLSGCGLMIQTVTRLLDVDLGVQTAGVIGAGLSIRERSYPDNPSRVALYERLLGTLQSQPGVSGAALSYPPPLAELNPQPVRSDAATTGAAGIVRVTPDYFAVLGIPLVQGRLFTASDRGSSEPVALVSQTAAQRLWPNGNAIGHTVRLDRPIEEDSSNVLRTVVGVVRDVRHSPTDDQPADVYVPMLQTPGRFNRIIVRAEGGTVSLDQLRRVVKELDSEASVGSVQPLDIAAQEQLARPRFLATMFAAFGVLATVLALIGVYGVIAYAVKQREHEVAVRMAVGADSQSVLRLFMGDSAVVLVVGIALGVFGALGIGRLLAAQLYGVRPLDPFTIAMAAAVLAAAALGASWWPARRATGIDPVTALREE